LFNEGGGQNAINLVNNKASTPGVALTSQGLPPLLLEGTGMLGNVPTISTGEFTIFLGQTPATGNMNTSAMSAFATVGAGHGVVGSRIGKLSTQTTLLTFLPRCSDETHYWLYGTNTPFESIAISVNNPSMAGYINGVLSGSEIGSGSWITTNETSVYTGGSAMTYRTCLKTILFSLFYNRALSADEIQRLHEMTKGW
jgi:hypothetical protein